MDGDGHEIDGQLDELASKLQNLHSGNLNRSAVEAGKELRRRAKQAQRIVPYLTANFHLMNCLQGTFESDFGADIAIESIALLASEERARQIQPDLPQDEYDHYVYWMSACSYDNLAKHVAARDGYNSDGVHDCINDGIQVCRQTGKMECITCFREYATDVYLASDDIDMALHHARAVASSVRHDTDNDRRWVGVKDTVRLLLLSGQLDAALDEALNGLRLVDSYHSPVDALSTAHLQIKTVLWLLGRQDEFESLTSAIPVAQKVTELPEGENLAGELEEAHLEALIASCQGEFESAIKLLTEWDQKLTKLKCLDPWFSVRLQLIATHRMAGNSDRIAGLSRQLETKAKAARDWLTLRLLKSVEDDTVPPAPVPFSASPTSGPFAASAESPSATGAEASGAAVEESYAETATEVPEATPFNDFFESLQSKFQAAESREDVAVLLKEVTDTSASDVTSVSDAERLLNVAQMFSPATENHADVWAWGSSFLVAFGQAAGVVNLVASLGHTLSSQAEDGSSGLPGPDRLEELFRQSLDLDSERAGNFARAGNFYTSEGRTGDAERCLARGFRLARDNGQIALQLSQIYSNTDRQSDALNVLELCLREGCEHPGVAWEAGLQALSLDKPTLAVTCLDQYEKVAADEPWTNYYRAIALLKSERPADALLAIDVEQARSPENKFSSEAIRAVAKADLEDRDGLRSQISSLEELRLSDVDYLTESGLLRLFELIHEAIAVLPESDSHRNAVESLTLKAGLTPDSYFNRFRGSGEKADVNYYVCSFKQPLGDDWPGFEGCLHGREKWNDYIATWGVLAENEQEAERITRDWQEKCYTVRPELLDVSLQGEDFQDHRGVVWQASHEPTTTD